MSKFGKAVVLGLGAFSLIRCGNNPTPEPDDALIPLSSVSAPTRLDYPFAVREGYVKLGSSERAVILKMLEGTRIRSSDQADDEISKIGEIYRRDRIFDSTTKLPFPYGEYDVVLKSGSKADSNILRIRPQQGPSGQKLLELNNFFSAESGDARASGTLFDANLKRVGSASSTEAHHELQFDKMPVYAFSKDGKFRTVMTVDCTKTYKYRDEYATDGSMNPWNVRTTDTLTEFMLHAKLSPEARDSVSDGKPLVFFAPSCFSGGVAAELPSDSTQTVSMRAEGSFIVVSNIKAWDKAQNDLRGKEKQNLYMSAYDHVQSVDATPYKWTARNKDYVRVPFKLPDGISEIKFRYHSFDPNNGTLRFKPASFDNKDLNRENAFLRNLIGNKALQIEEPPKDSDNTTYQDPPLIFANIRQWPTVNVARK